MKYAIIPVLLVGSVAAQAGKQEDADRALNCIATHDYVSHEMLVRRMGRMREELGKEKPSRFKICVNGTCTEQENPYYEAMSAALPNVGWKSVAAMGDRCMALLDQYADRYHEELSITPLEDAN